MTYPIDLEIAEEEDDLDGNWWNYIRLRDFMFMKKIPKDDYNAFEVNQSDILVHRMIKPGDIYPSTRYHIVNIEDGVGVSYQHESKEIKKYIFKSLVRYLTKIKRIPYGWKITDYQSNGKVKFKYEPIPKISFTVILEPKKMNLTVDRLKKFKTVVENTIEKKIEVQNTIDSIFDDRIVKSISDSTGGKVYINRATVMGIDRRMSVYKEHETVWYFFNLKGGTVAMDNKKGSEQYDFTFINSKCSELSFQKYGIKVGDIVSFNGHYKLDKTLGCHINNVRKYTKEV